MKLNKAQAELTRPANTTAYAASDCIANSTTQASVTPMVFGSLANTRAGTGYITKARLWVEGATVSAVFRLHLFINTPVMYADNEPYELLYTSLSNHIGFIDFVVSTTSGVGSTATLYEVADIRLAIESKDISGSNPVLGLLTAQTGFTPTSAQKFTVQLSCDAYEY